MPPNCNKRPASERCLLRLCTRHPRFYCSVICIMATLPVQTQARMCTHTVDHRDSLMVALQQMTIYNVHLALSYWCLCDPLEPGAHNGAVIIPAWGVTTTYVSIIRAWREWSTAPVLLRSLKSILLLSHPSPQDYESIWFAISICKVWCSGSSQWRTNARYFSKVTLYF